MPGDMADLYDEQFGFNADEDDEDGDNATCKRCGVGGLEWLNTGMRWILLEGNKPHQCANVASPDDFEALP